MSQSSDGSNAQSSLESLNDLFERLTRQRQFNRAYNLAVQITQTYPDDVHGWFKRHLMATLTSRYSEAAAVREVVARRPDYNQLIGGDLLRDYANGLIRQSHYTEALDVLESVSRLHTSDPNRLACAMGMQGRALNGLGRHFEAVGSHITADGLWVALSAKGEPCNQQWAYNNLLPTMKAFASAPEFGIGCWRILRRYYRQIVIGAPAYGTSQHIWRGRLLLLGSVGSKLDTKLSRLLRQLA